MSRPDYEKISFEIIEAFYSSIKRYSSGYTMLLHAINFIEWPSYEVIVAGNKNKSEKLLNYLYSNAQLNKVLIFRKEGMNLDKEFKFLEHYISDKNKEPLVYVCKNYACNLPTSDLKIIEKQLNN